MQIVSRALALWPLTLASAFAADPTVSLSFDPATTAPNAASLLRFDLFADTPNHDLAFTATLPLGLSFSSDIQTDCNALVSTVGNTLQVTEGRVGLPCSISVWVTGTNAGNFPVSTSQISTTAGNFAGGSAALDIDGTLMGFTSAFDPALTSAGEHTTVTFTLDATTLAAGSYVSDFNFALPPDTVIAPIPAAFSDCPGGTWTFENRASHVQFEGQVNGGTSCTASIDLVGEIAGAHTLVTSALNYGLDEAGAASANVGFTFGPVHIVSDDDPVGPGREANLRVQLTNTDRDGDASDIAFNLDLNSLVPGATLDSAVSDGCGPGSFATGSNLVTFGGASLATGETCVFDIAVDIPIGAATGAYTTSTSQATAIVNGQTVFWPAADVRLEVGPVPTTTLAVLTSPVGAGETVDVEYMIQNGSNALAASNVGFSQFQVLGDLATATFPSNGFCGAGSTLSFTPSVGDEAAKVVMQGGNIPPGGLCQFVVSYDVPLDTPTGPYPISTGPVSAVVGGETVFGQPGEAVIDVLSAPKLIASVVDEKPVPGDVITLEFQLLNGENAQNATMVGFDVDLDGWIPGMTVSGALPSDPCGAGSSIVGTNSLTLSNVVLATAEMCSFTVDATIPASTESGRYTIQTSDVTAEIGGRSYSSRGAELDTVIGGILLDSSMSPDHVAQGDTVTVTWNLTNVDPFLTADSIALSTDIDTTFPGAVFSNASTTCGVAANTVGSVVSISGASLAPFGACEVTATFDVPVNTEDGFHFHATPAPTAEYSGVVFDVGDGSIAELLVVAPTQWTVEVISEPTHAGEEARLAFRLENLDNALDLTDLAFDLDLGAALPGLTAIDLPAAPCGVGSSLTGTDTISLTGGNLVAGGSCVFLVDIVVPADATQPEYYPLTTSPLTATLDGGPVFAAARTADLLLKEPCRDGWEPDGSDCVDIDECATGTDTCDPNATCMNTVGSHDCACLPGFTGDGRTCTDIDECLANPCDSNATCTDLLGSFECNCDVGYIGDGFTCDAECGDGLIVGPESCDDGDLIFPGFLEDGDGCDTTCQIEFGWFCNFEPSICGTVCGDGIIIPGLEECDDDNQNENDGCSALCTLEPGFDCTADEPTVCNNICNDGLIVGDEQCDDLGNADGDGCTADCMIEDGYSCVGEPSVCELTCSNGVLDPGETCDDGDLDNGDGCDSICMVEPGWACVGEPSTCQESCSDGDIDPGEDCDDGNLELGDGCTDTCTVEDGWVCDSDGCIPDCGDGMTIGDEECDDGNNQNGDGCDRDCLIEDEECTGDDCEDTGEPGNRRTGCNCDVSGAPSPVGIVGIVGLLLGLAMARRRRAA